MLLQTNAGQFPATRQASGTPTAPGGTFGELMESRLSPDYYTLLKLGKVFSVAGLAQATIAAFTGGAAGTPLLGLWNPQGSGVDLVLLYIKLGIRTTGTTAGTVDFNHWLAQQGPTPITGTQTACKNKYSGANSGSAAYAMINVANTAALASSLVEPSFSLGNVTTTAGVNVGSLVDDLRGSIVVAPGNYYAWGAAAAMAVASLDFAAVWAEIPA